MAIFLSTPSGWRATLRSRFSLMFIVISIHALRVEGDLRTRQHLAAHYISIHALRVEGDVHRFRILPCIRISIHALRVEGDERSTQSHAVRTISIHALRVEGDRFLSHFSGGHPRDFYPRPPGGGRHKMHPEKAKNAGFLSTPSGWRATRFCSSAPRPCPTFLSTPSGWRATAHPAAILPHKTFLSTPSGWRATLIYRYLQRSRRKFLSTPSGWRATFFPLALPFKVCISIHALRVEGDSAPFDFPLSDYTFLSTPSGWRATAKTDKVFVCFCAKGRRICLFKTRKEKNLPVAF